MGINAIHYCYNSTAGESTNNLQLWEQGKKRKLSGIIQTKSLVIVIRVKLQNAFAVRDRHMRLRYSGSPRTNVEILAFVCVSQTAFVEKIN